MITVHAEFHSHFKELAATSRASFELEEPTVCALAASISARYGEKMQAMLIDPETQELNERGTMFVDTKGRRVSMEDTLEDGETITFLVGIAGG
jgi:molybdopterin converting factor small subunit